MKSPFDADYIVVKWVDKKNNLAFISPVERNKDGTINVITGMAIMTDIKEDKKYKVIGEMTEDTNGKDKA